MKKGGLSWLMVVLGVQDRAATWAASAQVEKREGSGCHGRKWVSLLYRSSLWR